MQQKLKIKSVKGPGIPVAGNDIDTDRIIPARYLKLITFKDLGNYAFYDARFNKDGSKKEHPFNDEKFASASILIVNKNFGSGSSREHAPQSLIRYGIKAIIGESFAEIFEGNCTALGMPTVIGSEVDVETLMKVINDDPALEIRIDLETMQVNYGDFSFEIKQKESSRAVLTEGKWDSLSELKSASKETKKLSEKLPYLNGFQ